MKKRLFVKNAAVMSVTSLILRGAGMTLRIYLSSVVGAEGMGLYSLIISVYAFLSAFSSAALVSVTTKTVTDASVNYGDAAGRCALSAACRLSSAGSIIMIAAAWVFSRTIAAEFIGDVKVAFALRLISLSLAALTVESCLKGYFLSKRNALIPSLGQIFEQAVRIGASFFALSFAADPYTAVTAIVAADLVSEVCSCIFLAISYAVSVRGQKRVFISGEARRFIKIAAPVGAGRYLTVGLRTVESLAVPGALVSSGMSRTAALGFFGQVRSMALPVLLFPSAFLSTISSLLIPEIGEARGSIRLQKGIGAAVKMTLQSSFFFAASFVFSGPQLGALIYGDETVGQLITVLGILVPAMYLETIIEGMLKALGQQNFSLIITLIDSSARVIFIFAGLPHTGIRGFIMMMIISNLFTASAGAIRLMKVSGAHFDTVNTLILPILFCFVSSSLSSAIADKMGANGVVYRILFIIISAAIYTSSLLLSNTLTLPHMVVKKTKKTVIDRL